MAARQFVHAPARSPRTLRLIAIKCRIGVSLGADIAPLCDTITGAADDRGVGKGRDRLRRTHGIDPSAIFLVDEKRSSRNRLEYELALLTCPRTPYTGSWRNIRQALNVFEHGRVEKHD